MTGWYIQILDIALINQNIEVLRKDTATNIEQIRQEAKITRELIQKDIKTLSKETNTNIEAISIEQLRQETKIDIALIRKDMNQYAVLYVKVTEVSIKCCVMNKMTSLGMPITELVEIS